MADPKNVQATKGSYEIEKELTEGELETASGGECLCKCAADTGSPSCGGGGGGGKAGFTDEEATA